MTISDDGGLDISWTGGQLRTPAGNTITVVAGSDTCTDDAVNHLKWVSGTGLTLGTTDAIHNAEVAIGHIACQNGNIWEVHVEPMIRDVVTDIQHGLEEVFPLTVASGCLVSEDGAGNDLDVTVSAGVYFHDLHDAHPISGFDTRTANTLIRCFIDGSGPETWDFTADGAQSEIDVANWNVGTLLIGTSVGKYYKGLLVISEDKVFWIYAQEQHNTVAQAIDGPLPSKPPGLDNFPSSVAYIYKHGDTTFEPVTSDRWMDVRPVVPGSIAAGPITDHGNLVGLPNDDHLQYLLLAGRSGQIINDVVSITGIGDGGLTNYDLQVGDTTTPDYGMIQFGNAVIGRTSYKAGAIDLDGTIMVRNIGGPVTSEIEFIWTESAGNTCRFALPKSAVGNATYNSRSMLLAGPAPADTDFVKVTYWQGQGIFDNLVCDTSGIGADLGVQNDLEVEGDIFTDSLRESTLGAGISLIGTATFVFRGGNIDHHRDGAINQYRNFSHSSGSTTHRALLGLRRSRGTEASEDAVVDGDQIGSFGFFGYDGTSYHQRAEVVGEVTGAVIDGSNQVPMSLIFKTGTTSRSDRLTIDHDGDVTLDTANVRLNFGGTDAYIEDFSGALRFGAASAHRLTIGDGIMAFLDGASTEGSLRWDATFVTIYNETTPRLRVSNGEVSITAQLHVGTSFAVPATSASIDLDSVTHALLLNRMTTTQRNALTAVNGMAMYNESTNDYNFYRNGSWQKVTNWSAA